MSKKKDIVYFEPADYFPKEIREKYGLGEFNADTEDEKPKKSVKRTKKTGKKKADQVKDAMKKA